MNINMDTNINYIDDEAGTQLVVELIYNYVYGHIDSRAHRSQAQTEIYDWLVNGSAYDCTVADLVAEWREYSGE